MEGPTFVYGLGVLFLVYGILKVLLVVAVMFLISEDTQKKLATIPGVNLLVTGDHTLAGKGGEIVLAAFGVFSIVHGLALMGMLPGGVAALIETKWFQYMSYTVFGIVLVVFYSLVLYTNLPIPKQEENRKLYWTYGYIGGASFLLIPVIWEASIRFIPYLSGMSRRKQLAMITALFLATGVVAYIIMVNIPSTI